MTTPHAAPIRRSPSRQHRTVLSGCRIAKLYGCSDGGRRESGCGQPFRCAPGGAAWRTPVRQDDASNQFDRCGAPVLRAMQTSAAATGRSRTRSDGAANDACWRVAYQHADALRALPRIAAFSRVSRALSAGHDRNAFEQSKHRLRGRWLRSCDPRARAARLGTHCEKARGRRAGRRRFARLSASRRAAGLVRRFGASRLHTVRTPEQWTSHPVAVQARGRDDASRNPRRVRNIGRRAGGRDARASRGGPVSNLSFHRRT